MKVTVYFNGGQATTKSDAVGLQRILEAARTGAHLQLDDPDGFHLFITAGAITGVAWRYEEAPPSAEVGADS